MIELLSWPVQVLIMSAMLYWLRATIDQQKGALVEIFAVTAPSALAAFITWLSWPSVTILGMGMVLTPIVVFTFLAMPALVAMRFGERLSQGEQPQLADIFRITTITGLSTFVVRQLEIDVRAVFFVSILTLTYLVGDRIATSQPRWRRATWWTIAAVVLVIIEVVEANMRLGSPLRPIAMVTELERPLMLGLLFAPAVWHWIMNSWGQFVHLGNWIEAFRMRLHNPKDAIYRRTIFRLWHFRRGVCYLNHGSFGAVPLKIQRAQEQWRERCQAEPMDVLARQTEPAWREARNRLAYWLGASPERVALCENATVAMNEIAHWFPLEEGDEVLLTDHEYGAVKRIWQRRCASASATARFVTLPMPFEDSDRVVDAILAACTSRTRLVVVSHITSPTAVILPVAKICSQLRERGIASCVDGPHALLQERIELNRLECDFYTASCHKWLCAPLGSGFVYVHPRWNDWIEPMRLSWGLLPPAQPKDWTDELTWIGTRDYSPYMAIPAAINFFSRFDHERLDARNYELACYARRALCNIPDSQPLAPESREWMGWMTAVWLPPGDFSDLQQTLWEGYGIEVPIYNFADRYLVRVSCHLYNSTQDIDRLMRALIRELNRRRGAK